MKKELPFVSVVVPAYNEQEFIGDCLDSLLGQEYPKHRYEIIVVDHCSIDQTFYIAESKAVKVIKCTEGRKVGAVRNQGVMIARGEIVAFIDADCIAGKNWLISAVEKLEFPSVGAVGGIYKLRKTPNWVERSWIPGNRSRDRITNSLIGGSFILRKTTFNQFKGFDEKINAGEDTRLSRQINESGLELWFLNDCAVVHLGFPRTLKDFARRQFWHSSSYLKSNNGVKDRTFVAVLAFIGLTLLSIVSLLLNNLSISLMLFLSSIFVVFTFTVKRLFFSGYTDLNYNYVPGAFLLDYIYFLSRSSGLFASVICDPKIRSKTLKKS